MIEILGYLDGVLVRQQMKQLISILDYVSDLKEPTQIQSLLSVISIAFQNPADLDWISSSSLQRFVKFAVDLKNTCAQVHIRDVVRVVCLLSEAT